MNKKLQHARLDRNWSMAMAARYIGVSRITYSRWESEEQTPHESTLMLICKAFKLSPVQLGFGQETKPARGEKHAFPLPEAGITLDISTVLAFLWHTYHCSFQELQGQVTEAMDQLAKNTSTTHFSRREMLSFLIGIPAAIASSTLIGSPNSLSAQEILPLYATGIPACWQLQFSGGWKQVREILPSYISQLTVLAQSSSKDQKMAIGLLSQAHQLAALVSKEEENYGASLIHCNQAFEYAKLAGDPNLQAASLLRRSDLYFARHLPTLDINQHAVKYAELDQISPLLQSRLYADWGATLASNGQKQEALRYQGMAQDMFPDDATNDPGFSYTHTTRYILCLNETLTHLRLDKPQEAFKTISQAGNYVPETMSGRRMELLQHLVLASISMNDLEQSIAQIENMASMASQLDSAHWQTELQSLASQLNTKWPQEKRIKRFQEALPNHS